MPSPMMPTTASTLLIIATLLQIATLAYAVLRLRSGQTTGARAAWLALSSMALLLLIRGGAIASGVAAALPGGLGVGVAAETVALILSSKLLLGLGLLDREARRAAQAAAQQRAFLRDVLRAVTGGKLAFASAPGEMPAPPLDVAPLALVPSSLGTLRRNLAEAADACGLTETRRCDLVLAAGEAAMNAVVHGGGGSAKIVVDRFEGTVRVWVEDRGAGIDLSRLPRAALEPGYSSAGTLGQGFPMILQAADRVSLSTGAAGTTVVIEVRREDVAEDSTPAAAVPTEAGPVVTGTFGRWTNAAVGLREAV